MSSYFYDIEICNFRGIDHLKVDGLTSGGGVHAFRRVEPVDADTRKLFEELTISHD